MWSKQVVLGLIGGVFGGLFMVLVPHLPQIATVDIAAITEQFIKQEAQKNLSVQEKQQAIQSFSHALEESLEQLSASKSLIIFPKEAVLKGAKDYTPALKQMMHLETNA